MCYTKAGSLFVLLLAAAVNSERQEALNSQDGTSFQQSFEFAAGPSEVLLSQHSGRISRRLTEKKNQVERLEREISQSSDALRSAETQLAEQTTANIERQKKKQQASEAATKLEATYKEVMKMIQDELATEAEEERPRPGVLDHGSAFLSHINPFSSTNYKKSSCAKLYDDDCALVDTVEQFDKKMKETATEEELLETTVSSAAVEEDIADTKSAVKDDRAQLDALEAKLAKVQHKYDSIRGGYDELVKRVEDVLREAELETETRPAPAPPPPQGSATLEIKQTGKFQRQSNVAKPSASKPI